MPGFIKTKEDERLWKKAQGIAEKNGLKEDWPYITGIYKKMRGGKVGAIISDFDVVQNLVGKTVANVSIADFDGVADVTMSDGSMVFIHTPPPGAKAITSSMVNDPFTVLDLKGRHVEAVAPTDWDPHVVNVMFDNGSVVSLHAAGKIQAKERIPGGLAKGKKPEDFDAKALAKGKKVEMEHTDDPNVAQEIAMDHLTEDPKYYDKLEVMEKEAGQLAARFIRKAVFVGDPEGQLAERFLSRKAALINTETASVYVMAGEHLKKIIEEGEYSSALADNDFNRADKVVLDVGGLVFHTGADGSYEVDVKPAK